MDLRSLRGVGPTFGERLQEAGIHDIEDLAWVSDLSTLADRTGIPTPRLADFQAQAVKRVAQRHRPPAVALQSVAAAMLDLMDEAKEVTMAGLEHARAWIAKRAARPTS